MMLVLVLCLSAVPFAALAAEEEEEPAAEVTAEEEVEVAEETAEATEAEDVKPSEEGESAAAESASEAAVEEEPAAPLTDGAEDDVIFSTIEEAAVYIREQMVARNTSFSFSYDFNQFFSKDTVQDDVQDIVDDMVEMALEHTGVPNEGDYIWWNYEGYYLDNYYYSYDPSTGLLTDTVLTLSFSVGYHTTADQEAQVTERIDSILDSLNLDGKSDYEKICAIYKWISNNVAYDYDNKYDESYTLKCTAYAALFDGKAVCQGFCNLFYQMLLKCGIDNRIVCGISTPPTTNTGEEQHTWNIVNLDGVYYETDVTWDVDFTDSYQYFLCSNAEFDATHVRYNEYTTTEFVTAYPYATSAYDPSAAGSGTTGGASGNSSDNTAGGTSSSSSDETTGGTSGNSSDGATSGATGSTSDGTSTGGTSSNTTSGGTSSITPSGLAGDVNGNGLVNISDVQLLLKYVNGQSVSVVEEACDVDNSDIVNISDVQLLLKYVNGQNVTIY